MVRVIINNKTLICFKESYRTPMPSPPTDTGSELTKSFSKIFETKFNQKIK